MWPVAVKSKSNWFSPHWLTPALGHGSGFGDLPRWVVRHEILEWSADSGVRFWHDPVRRSLRFRTKAAAVMFMMRWG
jgi:hypothetical protein